MTASATGLPFDDILSLLKTMPTADEDTRAKIRDREAQLTKPAGSLGRLEELAEWVAVWQRQSPPQILRPLVAVFAANHGVASKGVSAFPSSLNHQMVANFAAGGAAINQICIANDLGLKVFDLALDYPSGDISVEAALTEQECVATIAFGMEAIAGGTDLLCLGEMGIGNTTISAALFAALFGGTGADWVGRGSGVDDAGLQRKIDVVDQALETHKDHLGKPLEVLRRLGGREFAAMVGAVLAARQQNIPVIVDGFNTTAAVAVLYKLDPSSIDHCIFSHCSAEGAHKNALDKMGKTALLDLGMRLGEGTGAAIAAGIVKAACKLHEGMATFEQAGVDLPE
ncbi:nicotinate-nucleotide--dimethylbenzimidazole phosphoribosyltransferase [Cohaesibacter celericrescens]|uniref:Nicotinate-nucleotide--dimethylbenzimidazole phosphoribosyltransferase n=1 Tax=Cohaesibacter celericrescens TaxID=2067669 RepID=A0A2N5XQR2_9HYPH|nr:nicotinate-nucleotide--dimethylbenzimidazole phosphoribosyltransferase [Cohaesibacter celericrescens]PLW76780.1 nicotinate-nucleotide--dimethylbenzimidazole phosphoribosyltransferase [Cohaesibacter celericrescens]